MHRLIAYTLLLLCCASVATAQENSDTTLSHSTASKFLSHTSRQSTALNQKLDKKTRKALSSLQKQEEKLYKQLSKLDSSAAAKALAESKAKYAALHSRLKQAVNGPYISKLDSLSTSLSFLQNSALNGTAGDVQDKIKSTLSTVSALKDQFGKAETVKQFLKERRELLKQQLSRFGFAKQLKKLNKQVYYYSQQVNEYKAMLKDSRKAERKALELLSKTKLFKDFFRKNSQLASLFRLPGDPADPSQASLAGLQTRAQVNSLIQQRIAAGGPGAQQQFSQNVQSAQAQINQLKDKILKAGGGDNTTDMPDFKPKNLKTKSFLQRLEYGTNVQTVKGTRFFPVTSDIALSVGYKLSEKSIIGLGASYKMGWGNGWRDLTISHQGIGLRSYADIKLKGSFWLSGGYEQNYRSQFNRLDVLQDLSAWQRSGLIGVSKVVSLKTKFFKKTKLQLLWDFLSYEQVPRVQPLVLRVGYSF